jgi:photosystem II stability/assembly factor-like uncharacterized protein
MKSAALYFIASICFLMIFPIEAVAQWVKNGLPYSIGNTISTLTENGKYIIAGTGSGLDAYENAVSSGIFRSTDSGTSWSASNSGLTDFSIYSSAKIGDNILVGTEAGIFRSTNNGASWNNVYSGVVYSFALSGNYIYAGSDGRLLYCADSGKSWMADTTGVFADAEYQLLAVSGNVIFAVINGSVYRSTDEGASWTAADSGLPNLAVISFTVNGRNVFAGINFGGIYRSADSGKKWVEADAGLPENSDGASALSIFVSGTTLFAGLDTSVYRSLDSGNTWGLVNSGGGGYAFAASGNRIMVGGFGGFRYSTDGGTTWIPSNTGLNTYTVNAFSKTGNSIVTGTSAGIFRTTNSGNSWTEVSQSSANALAVIGNNTFAAGESLFRSKDSGATWASIDSATLPNYFLSLLVNGTELFAGCSEYIGACNGPPSPTLFRSSDSGNKWSAITSGLPFEYNCDVYTIAYDYFGISSLAAIGKTLFAGIAVGLNVFRSTDSGSIWTIDSNGLTDQLVTCLATNGSSLYAGTDSGIFFLRDTGTTWTASNSGLTNTNIQALFATGPDLFAGTHGGGVFHSSDSGKTWTPFNNGLTDSSIQSFGVNDTYLFAGVGPGTYGGSVWRYPLSQVSVKRAQQIRPELASLKVHSMGRFNPAVGIDFSIPSTEKVSIGVYDLSGHLVTQLDDKLFVAGQHTLQWNARNAGSGCYVVRMQAGESVQVKAIPLVR